MEKLPHDLLPIKRPLEDANYPESTYFYKNVVSKLIPDIIRMEASGIPINLAKVADVEKTIDNVLEQVYTKLQNNSMMLTFLESVDNEYKANKTKVLESKKKTYEDFLKPFNIKNKTHKSYVVNAQLSLMGKSDMVLPEWSNKDLKKLNQIIASKFINDLLEGHIQEYMFPVINLAMEQLAKDKADAYNKNKVDTKIDEIKTTTSISTFNPGSSLQKQKFFAFYNIESEKETAAGSPQWDRKELERIQKLLAMLIEDKGEKDEL